MAKTGIVSPDSNYVLVEVFTLDKEAEVRTPLHLNRARALTRVIECVGLDIDPRSP